MIRVGYLLRAARGARRCGLDYHDRLLCAALAVWMCLLTLISLNTPCAVAGDESYGITVYPDRSAAPAGKPFPDTRSKPTQRALNRVYFALLRDVVLQSLRNPAGASRPDAQTMQRLEQAVIAACARAGEMPDIGAPEFHFLGKRLCALADANGRPPALRILGAYLHYYSYGVANLPADADGFKIREQTAFALQPAEADLAGLPPLLRAIWHLNRTQYTNDKETLKYGRLYLENMLAAVAALAPSGGGTDTPTPTDYDSSMDLCASTADWVATAGIAAYASTARLQRHQLLIGRALREGQVSRHPYARKALEFVAARAILQHRYSEKMTESGLWLRDDPAWAWLGHLAAGEQALHAAWDARGGRFASKVSESGWRGFHENSSKAIDSFTRSWTLRPDQPAAAAGMIRALVGADGGNATMRDWLDKGLATCPDYTELFDHYEFYVLEPRWGGSAKWKKQFAFECINAGGYDTYRPYYGWYQLRENFTKQKECRDWRRLWRQKDVQAAADRFFAGIFAEPQQAFLQQRMRAGHALYLLWAGRYAESAAEFAALPQAKQLLAMQIPPVAACVSWGRIGWQRIQDELYANTGPHAAAIRAGEDLVCQDKAAEGVARWREVIEACRGKDERVAGYLRWRAGYVLVEVDWDFGIPDYDFRLDRSPLTLAVLADDNKTIRWLLDAGEDPFEAAADGMTPVLMACRENRLAFLQGLPKERLTAAYLNAPQPEGVTLVTEAMQTDNPELVRFLAAAGVDVNQANKEDLTPLYIASRANKPEIVRALLEAKANPDRACTKRQETPLHSAAADGYDDILQLLLDAGCKVNVVDKKKRTALYRAVYDKHLSSAKLLLAYKADVNATCEGWTPLMVAAYNDDLPMVRLLLEHGADPEKKSGSLDALQAGKKSSPELQSVLRDAIRSGRTMLPPK